MLREIAATSAEEERRDGFSTVSLLKGVGYAVSTLSVILLGIVSWKNASEQPLLFACLLAGMASSMVGMLLRWISHRIEQKEKAAAAAPSAIAQSQRRTGNRSFAFQSSRAD